MRVLILLIFVATAAYASQEECGENAHFVECGFACPLTCENYKKPPSMCALKCATGCHCDKGFVKAANGTCVRPEECPASVQEQECSANAHFESCGTACPLTCENYKNPPKVCVLRCDIGCQCDKGFVKADDGSCVKPEECPASVQEQECGANAHFENCGTACPLTCENYKNPPKACVLRCDIGCQCDKGFVKAADGSCVRPEECPASVQEQECGANAHFESCGTACPLTCENYKNPPIACNFMCDIGCHCDKGYVKAADGSCVRPEQCPASGPERIVAEEETETRTCDMPAETGVCRGFFPRFYFDRISGTCEKFIYGGCGGNENNFETIEECQSTCGRAAPSACLEEKKVGPCRAGFPRFYFNKETGQCEKFLYGGCLGNSNNFMTQEDCEAVCKT